MIPIRDDNPTHSKAYLTIGLIVINSLIFLYQVTRPGQEGEAFLWKYGYIPAKLVTSAEEFERELPERAPIVPMVDRHGRVQRDIFGRPVAVRQPIPVEAATEVPAGLSILTCMFLHGGWMHLIGNMLYLWIFGNKVEERLGAPLFLLFYLGTGIVGNLAHTYFEHSWVPLVGASGAISGVMGGYILLYPHARILAIAPLGFYWLTVKLPAWLFLGVYVLAQNLWPAYFGRSDGVAYWAHLGGFAAGAALIYAFPHRRPTRFAPPVSRRVDDDDADIVF